MGNNLKIKTKISFMLPLKVNITTQMIHKIKGRKRFYKHNDENEKKFHVQFVMILSESEFYIFKLTRNLER